MIIAYTYPVFNQKIGGVSRYFFEICSRLKFEYKLIFVTRFSINVYFANILFQKKAFLKGVDFPGKWRIIEYLQGRYTKRVFKNKVFDLIHHTGDFSEIFDFETHNKPIVITIHDMTPELYYSSDKKRVESRKRCIEQSTAIICVSNNTKHDLLKFYPMLDKNKVFVVYHGFDTNEYIYQEKDKNVYILYVGSRYIYKNFLFFLSSISSLLKERGMFLYCTGNSFTTEEIKLINKLKLSDLVINMGIVNDDQLSNLFHNSACFVYPSLYEGFGIPILEAFKHKCPVALSNTSCFPEIAKDSAIYFNPNDSKSIQNTIIEVIENRQNLIELGSKRICDFSWDNAAEGTSKVYKWAIEKNKLRI